VSSLPKILHGHETGGWSKTGRLCPPPRPGLKPPLNVIKSMVVDFSLKSGQVSVQQGLAGLDNISQYTRGFSLRATEFVLAVELDCCLSLKMQF